MTDAMLDSIYIEDGLGTRIVNLLPDDMFREGWTYEFPEEDELKIEELSDRYNEILESIGAVEKVRKAFYSARLKGGAAILRGALDGQPLDAPLKPSRIRSFEYLRVIARSSIEYSRIKFQLDPEKPRYMMPEFYPISFVTPTGSQEIRDVHFSRIIELQGAPVPVDAKELTNEQQYWGLSVLQNVENHLAIVGSSIGSVGHLLNEFSVGKFKLANLSTILSEPDGAETVKKRVEVNDVTRSVFHSMYLDKEDEFIRENVSFAGVPQVLYILFMLVSSCTGYPITRLFGVSPGGMNATGESDMRNYYDAVRSDQKAEAEPVMLRLLRIISEWKKLPEPYIKWNPLQSASPKEQAEIDKLEADKESVVASTYQAYISAGIMEPYEARYLQFGDTLDKIPVPEDLLPDVETLPEVPLGEDGEKPEENPDPEGADETEEDENTEGDPADKKSEEEDNPKAAKKK
jgi:phage-related protein (TIGR01555 family)